VNRERGKEAWAIDMMLELFHKAMGGRRAVDADRVMRQIMSGLETHLRNGLRFDIERLLPVTDAAIELSKVQNSAFWVHWASDFCGRAGVPISPALAEAGARWQAVVPTGTSTPPGAATKPGETG
jgi:hypothetical protein